MVEPILVNGKQRASLRFPAFTTTFQTVAEAVDHWQKLESAEREHAVLVLETGHTYQPAEIPLLRLDR